MAGWRSHPKIQEAKRKGAAQKGRPMWYVVQVETGREKTACDDIKQAADDVLDECFVPQYLTGKRRPDGTWIPSKERLFPGYLICVTSQVDELADKLRRVRSLTKILKNDNAFIPLTEDERAWVQKVTQKDQRTVGESVGYMDNGKLVIVEGPLKGREDWVRKVNHRKRLAYLEMPMGGRTVRAQAGLQMVSKAQGKLLDREK